MTRGRVRGPESLKCYLMLEPSSQCSHAGGRPTNLPLSNPTCHSCFTFVGNDIVMSLSVLSALTTSFVVFLLLNSLNVFPDILLHRVCYVRSSFRTFLSLFKVGKVLRKRRLKINTSECSTHTTRLLSRRKERALRSEMWGSFVDVGVKQRQKNISWVA